MQLRLNEKEAKRGITTILYSSQNSDFLGYKRLLVSWLVAAKKFMTTLLRKLISPQIHTEHFE